MFCSEGYDASYRDGEDVLRRGAIRIVRSINGQRPS